MLANGKSHWVFIFILALILSHGQFSQSSTTSYYYIKGWNQGVNFCKGHRPKIRGTIGMYPPWVEGSNHRRTIRELSSLLVLICKTGCRKVRSSNSGAYLLAWIATTNNEVVPQNLNDGEKIDRGGKQIMSRWCTSSPSDCDRGMQAMHLPFWLLWY